MLPSDWLCLDPSSPLAAVASTRSTLASYMLDEERGSPRSIGGDPHLWDVELSSIGRVRHVTDSAFRSARSAAQENFCPPNDSFDFRGCIILTSNLI